MRVVLFLLFVSINIFASMIHFEEEKYIYAIDDTLYKQGTLNFTKNTTALQYNGSEKTLFYSNDTLVLKDGNSTIPIDSNSKNILKVVFLLIESIYYNQLENLDEYFTIKKAQTIILKPKDILENYIEQVEFKKEDRLQFLTIQMKNQNKTTIRQIDE